jgi:hypothetical protein
MMRAGGTIEKRPVLTLRALRVSEAARIMNIRIVPPDPDPTEFKRVTFACDARPHRCGICHRGFCEYYDFYENGLRW